MRSQTLLEARWILLILALGGVAYPQTAAPPDFTLSVSPPSRSITAGSSTTYTATITPTGGFTGSVTLTASVAPAGPPATFNPTSVTTSGTSTLTLATSPSTPAVPYTVTITATSGTLSHASQVSLTVTPCRSLGNSGKCMASTSARRTSKSATPIRMRRRCG